MHQPTCFLTAVAIRCCCGARQDGAAQQQQEAQQRKADAASERVNPEAALREAQAAAAREAEAAEQLQRGEAATARDAAAAHERATRLHQRTREEPTQLVTSSGQQQRLGADIARLQLLPAPAREDALWAEREARAMLEEEELQRGGANRQWEEELAKVIRRIAWLEAAAQMDR